MDLIHPVHYLRFVFSTSTVSESQANQLCEKHLLFSCIKHTQTSVYLHRYSYVFCNVEIVSYAMC